MKQPTEQEIKEFWEGLGIFEIKSSFKGDPLGISAITVPKSLPPIDLNSLFKYAVPKLRAVIRKQCNRGPHHYSAKAYTRLVFDNWLDKVLSRGKDPALALFWVIKSVSK